MSNILVTGGAGFIGSHLVKKLAENEDNHIIVVDNLITTGTPIYIKSLIEDKRITFINSDICDPNLIYTVSEVLCGNRLDYVYNLASPASVRLYTKVPLLTFKTSTTGVLNILNLARTLGTDKVKFLETSTSEAYGDPLETPQSESYFGNVNTQCNRSCYDEGKRSAEVLCYLYKNIYGLNTHIARLFNCYGTNNTDDRVVPTFIQQALLNKDITVYGDGTQTRSFCYVRDTVEGLMKLIETDYSNPVNIGNPHEVTIQDLAVTVRELCRSKSKIVHKDLPEFDPKRRCPDITLAKSLLNWEPKVTLNEGLLLVKADIQVKYTSEQMESNLNKLT